MYQPVVNIGRRCGIGGVALVVFAAGCDLLFPVIPGINPPDSAGNSIATARLISFDSDDRASLSGTITGTESDVYDLGPVAAGDRVIISVTAALGSSLDPTIAVLDADEEVFAVNDDVDFAGGNYNSAVDDYVAEASSHFFLAITKFFMGSQSGSYDATVEIVRGGTKPTPPVQTLLLNFAGGQATITGEGTYLLDPFDAADIDEVYAGATDTIKAKIVEVVKENFEDTGLVIVTTDENPVLEAGTFSTIHFGAFSGTKFGIADDVDAGNRNRCDDGIVYTERFDDPFAVQPSTEGIAVAIGNVASHEAGHLLGLNHVADVTALMDNTGSASTLLADQEFKTAPLSPSIFRFGNQNDMKLLQRVVPKLP